MNRKLVEKVSLGSALNLPHITIIYCFNRAVVSYETNHETYGHKDVFYGPFFGFRLGKATRIVNAEMKHWIKTMPDCQCRTCARFKIKNCKNNLGCNKCYGRT